MTTSIYRSRGFRRASALAALAVVIGAPSLRAHDMWIEPARFSPAGGQIVSLRLRVGQDLLGDPLALDPALVTDFIVHDAAGRRPIVRRDGGDPAGLVRTAAPGLTVIGYASRPSLVELTADTFNRYLKEEGLDAVAALRAQHNQTRTPVREAFSRCAKSLINVGASTATQHDRALGFTLELVAERDPYAMRVNDEMPVQLLYQGLPIGNVLVVAINKQDPTAKVAARTDAGGRVRLKLGRPGVWLVKAVHMIPAPAGVDATWASYWASVTFDLHDAPAAGTTR